MCARVDPKSTISIEDNTDRPSSFILSADESNTMDSHNWAWPIDLTSWPSDEDVGASLAQRIERAVSSPPSMIETVNFDLDVEMEDDDCDVEMEDVARDAVGSGCVTPDFPMQDVQSVQLPPALPVTGGWGRPTLKSEPSEQ